MAIHDFRIQFIKELDKWIRSNLQNRLSIAEVTIKSGYSFRYIQHIFKQEMKTTLGAYIKKKRLELAIQYLLESDLSIKDIAHKAGFTSQQAFTRSFKDNIGKSPKQYRKKSINYQAMPSEPALRECPINY